ncbi:hypothetical protein [Halomonas campaniensis]|uniref:hypothetical protein n=1 Tax=Halomonas campaniensis TaxID=213554 RepID=UPI003564839B
MTVTRQQFESILTGANQRLAADREARKEEFFNNELLGDSGEIFISGEQFHPADILEALAEETYRVARSESDQRYSEEVSEAVIESYPTPIALAYNAFLHGSTHALTRLNHMRDTWEAVVNICFSVVVLEAAARNIKLHDVIMRDGPLSNPRVIARRDLKSDSIAVRLGCIEGILVYLKLIGASVHAEKIVPVEVIGEMRRLNDVRNGFSHEQTKSEPQAVKIIEECHDDLLNVLDDLNRLAEVELYRVHGISNFHPDTLEVERLNGSNIARRISRLAVNASDVALCAGTPRPGDLDPVFIRCQQFMCLASPYLYCRHDETGHQTRVLMLKRILMADNKARFEISGYSVGMEIEFPRVQPEVARIEALLDP